MAVLVTGGSGFIGRHLVRELAKRQTAEIRVIDITIDPELKSELRNVSFHELDITLIDPPQWKNLLDGVNVIYHLGGLLGTSELFARITEAERVNVLGTLNILEAMRNNNIKKIIFTSKPNMWKHNVYTITKENCEKYLEMYRVIYGLEPVVLRPFNVYGPEEKVEQYRKAVPYFIISAIKNEPIEIFGNGEQTMDLIHVNDCVEAFVTAADTSQIGNNPIELGSGKDTSVNDLAKLIIKLAGSKSEIKYVHMRKGEVKDSRIKANTKNMEKILKYKLRTSLEDGLTDTIAYYKNNLSKYKIYQFQESEFSF